MSLLTYQICQRPTKIKAAPSRAAKKYSLLSVSFVSDWRSLTSSEGSHDTLCVRGEYHHRSEQSLHLIDLLELFLDIIFVDEHVFCLFNHLSTVVALKSDWDLLFFVLAKDWIPLCCWSWFCSPRVKRILSCMYQFLNPAQYEQHCLRSHRSRCR